MSATNPPEPSLTHHAAFHTTRWSMVLAAQGKLSSPEAFDSLEALCRQYWPPLYAYVRHCGHTAHDAQDLTQEFFARLLKKDWLTAADRGRGRFRSFLLMALKRFLANEWDRSQARKRGGGFRMICLDTEVAENLYASNAASLPADILYERRWALTLLETVIGRLQKEYDSLGRLDDYHLLKPSLTAERGGVDYAALAVALKMEPASARSAVHRLRKRFREVFREEISATVADPGEVEDEMRAVIAALGAA